MAQVILVKCNIDNNLSTFPLQFATIFAFTKYSCFIAFMAALEDILYIVFIKHSETFSGICFPKFLYFYYSTEVDHMIISGRDFFFSRYMQFLK